MLNLILTNTAHKIHEVSLKNLYRNIIKLEWFAIASLMTWLLFVFLMILN